MTKPLIVAVDPGQSGAIVWTQDFVDIQIEKMPPTDVEVAQLIASLCFKAKDVEVYLEEPSTAGYGPLIPASSIARLAQNFGIIYGASIAKGFAVRRTKPQAWQAVHGLGKKKDHGKGWKNHLKGKAIELWPMLDVTLANADALLILDAARRGAIN
jgi:hypothetical protein